MTEYALIHDGKIITYGSNVTHALVEEEIKDFVNVYEDQPVFDPDTGVQVGVEQVHIGWREEFTGERHVVLTTVSAPLDMSQIDFEALGWQPIEERGKKDDVPQTAGEIRVVRGKPVRDWSDTPPPQPTPPTAEERLNALLDQLSNAQSLEDVNAAAAQAKEL